MPITLNGLALDIVSEWKYLGTTIKSGKRFAFSARPDISSFYWAANSVLNVLTDAHEHVLMNLFYYIRISFQFSLTPVLRKSILHPIATLL